MEATIIRIEGDLYDNTADVRFRYKTGQTSRAGAIDREIVSEFDLVVSLDAARNYNIGQEVDITII